jgi:hypothetical protein
VGVSLWPPFCIPNSSPSPVRFNPDELKLRLMRTNSPKMSPSRIRIGPSLFSSVMLSLRQVWVSLNLFLIKASPSPSNARWSKPVACFWCDARVLVGMRFLGYLPWESVTLAFECVAVKTLGWFDSFWRGLNVTLPRLVLKVGLLGLCDFGPIKSCGGNTRGWFFTTAIYSRGWCDLFLLLIGKQARIDVTSGIHYRS